MNVDSIKQQIETSKLMISEFKKQNLIFENILQEAMKGVPKENQAQFEQVRNLYLRAKKLAKEGKIDEVNALIKEFKDGCKNSK